jgi:hypothetical protein
MRLRNFVKSNRAEPGFEAGLTPELGQVPEGSQHRLLYDVFRLRLTAHAQAG